MTSGKITEAIDSYGREVVSLVREAVAMSDPDGAWAAFSDMGMFEHAECLEFLYFEE